MASYLQRHWKAKFEGMGGRDWKGGSYDAYLADPIKDWSLFVPADVIADIIDAESAIKTLNNVGASHKSVTGLAGFFLRTESVGSSKIEGILPGAKRVANAEADIALTGTSNDFAAVELIGNFEAMESAIALAANADSFRLEDLLTIHRTLMDKSPTPELGGVVRTEQNWIGGGNYNPIGAAFVPPPPEYLDDLLDDLMEYINDDLHPPLVQAGVAHAQFETLHPFGDGNGRTGRALIHAILRRRGLAPSLIPPISNVFAAYPKDYVAGLVTFRHLARPDSTERSKAAASWLQSFAIAIRKACHAADQNIADIETLMARWRTKLGGIRANSSTDLLLNALLGTPTITAKSAGELIARTHPAVNAAIKSLVDAGILRQRNTHKQRYRIFEAPDVIELFDKLETVM